MPERVTFAEVNNGAKEGKKRFFSIPANVSVTVNV